MFDMFGELRGVGVKGERVICWKLLSIATKVWTYLSLVQIGLFFMSEPVHPCQGDEICGLAQTLKTHIHTYTDTHNGLD